MVSGGGTNLQAIINAVDSGKIKNGRITAVISNKPGVFALERAKKADIPAVVIDKKNCRDKAEFNKLLLDELKKAKAELIVLAGFLVILDKEIIDKYRDKIINVHPSLIPAFCGDGFYGLKVHEKVLEAGVKITGATVHYVNEIPDGGKIIMQKAVEVHEGDTPEILQKRVMEEAEWVILPEAINKICNEKSEAENIEQH